MQLHIHFRCVATDSFVSMLSSSSTQCLLSLVILGYVVRLYFHHQRPLLSCTHAQQSIANRETRKLIVELDDVEDVSLLEGSTALI